MSAIIVIKKNGNREEFPETYHAGGSMRTHVKYKENFAIIEDAYGRQTVFPSDDIERIIVESPRGW